MQHTNLYANILLLTANPVMPIYILITRKVLRYPVVQIFNAKLHLVQHRSNRWMELKKTYEPEIGTLGVHFFCFISEPMDSCVILIFLSSILKALIEGASKAMSSHNSDYWQICHLIRNLSIYLNHFLCGFGWKTAWKAFILNLRKISIIIVLTQTRV